MSKVKQVFLVISQQKQAVTVQAFIKDVEKLKLRTDSAGMTYEGLVLGGILEKWATSGPPGTVQVAERLIKGNLNDQTFEQLKEAVDRAEVVLTSLTMICSLGSF
jgi:hypothetical protein